MDEETRRIIECAKCPGPVCNSAAFMKGPENCPTKVEADVIEDELETAARNFINSTEVLILPEKKKVFLSQIFNWYKKDFGGKEKIFHFLLEHLDKDEKPAFLKENMDNIAIEYLFYDWNLNH